MTVRVERDVGHPWTGALGWDHLWLEAVSPARFQLMLKAAESKHWQVWVQDDGGTRALLYKPSGCTAAWVDDPRQGLPPDRCQALAVGDAVYTDFSGTITRHRVVERTTRAVSGHVSQTDCQLRVSPPVKGSGYVADSPHDKVQQKGLAWMDAAWFRLAA